MSAWRGFLSWLQRDPYEPERVIDVTSDEQYQQFQGWMDAAFNDIRRRLTNLERAQNPPTTRGLINESIAKAEQLMDMSPVTLTKRARSQELLDILYEIKRRQLKAEGVEVTTT